MKRQINLAWAFGLCVSALLTLAGQARADRNDLLMSLEEGDPVTVALNGTTGLQSIASGTVSLQTAAPFCVATPSTPCTYNVNYILVTLKPFTVSTNQGVYSLDQPYSLIRGPLVLTDTGSGLTIPRGTTAEVGAVIAGPNVPKGQRFNDTPVSSDVTLLLSAANGTLTIDGSLPFSFFISQINQQIDGSMTGLIVANSPFVNTAPVAVAGASRSVVCPQAVTLDGSGSTDRENNIAFYDWTLRSAGGSSAAVGVTTAPVFAEGTTDVTLEVFDTFGAVGQAQTTVTVTIPAPTFGAVPPSVTLQSCSSGASAVSIPVPSATVCGANVTPVGTVTSFNGAAVSIPVTTAGTIDVPPGTGTVQWVATNQDGVSTTVTQSVVVLAPATLYSFSGVTIDDGTKVNGTIYAGSGGTSLFEPDVVLTQAFSLAPVSVQDRVTATLIDSNAGITFSNASTDHVTTSTATPVLPAQPKVSMTFTGTTAEVVHPTPQSPFVLSLAPGQYGAVTVYSRGQLILSAGTYAFTSLDLEPQASIVTPSAAAESVKVFVENAVTYSGSTVDATGALAPLFLAYLGSNPLSIGTAFTGTVIAPNASLTLQSLNGQGVFDGEFFAKQIAVFPNDIVNSNPFTCGH